MYSELLITWVSLDKLSNFLVMLEGRFFFLGGGSEMSHPFVTVFIFILSKIRNVVAFQ